MTEPSGDDKQFSVEPKLPHFSTLWREAAYRISKLTKENARGCGDVYLQIASRFAIGDYPYESPEYRRKYTVKSGEFFTSRNALAKLSCKNPKTLKRILEILVSLGLIDVEDFGDCICVKIVQEPARYRTPPCGLNPIGPPIGIKPQGYGNLTTGVWELNDRSCGLNPIPNIKKRSRNNKGESKSVSRQETPPPFSNLKESGNQEKPIEAPPSNPTNLSKESSGTDSEPPLKVGLEPLQVWEIRRSELMTQRKIESASSPNFVDLSFAQKLINEEKTEEKVTLAIKKYVAMDKPIYQSRTWPMKFLIEDLESIKASKALEEMQALEKTRMEEMAIREAEKLRRVIEAEERKKRREDPLPKGWLVKGAQREPY